MPTALQTLNLRAMSLASGYGEWSPTRGRGSLDSLTFASGMGTFRDASPGKVRLYNHDPKRDLGQVAFGSFHENYLYEKALKLRWYAWPPGDDCMSKKFTAAWVEKIKNGANKLTTGSSKMGCEFCRDEPLADVEKTPTQVTPEVVFGTTATTWPEGSTPPKQSVADLRVALEEAEQAEAAALTAALTEESGAAVEPSGAPMEPTEVTPSALPESTPPTATKPKLSECPGCGKPGKGQSVKKRSSSVYAHIRSNPDHAETPIGVPA